MSTREAISSPTVHTYRPGGLPVAYSDGVCVNGGGRLLFISGQVGLDLDGTVVSNEVDAQARQALNNVRAIVEGAGGTIENIVKLTTFIKSRSLVEAYLRVRREFFPDHNLPASTTVVADFVDDRFLIEIEAIAALE